jgi:hypothetical protein
LATGDLEEPEVVEVFEAMREKFSAKVASLRDNSFN